MIWLRTLATALAFLTAVATPVSAQPASRPTKDMAAADMKYSFEGVLDPLKRPPHYDNIRAIHIVTDRPFPLLLERLVLFPIVPQLRW